MGCESRGEPLHNIVELVVALTEDDILFCQHTIRQLKKIFSALPVPYILVKIHSVRYLNRVHCSLSCSYLCLVSEHQINSGRDKKVNSYCRPRF